MRALLMTMIVFCAAGQALALTPLGPPRAGLKKGKKSLGFVFAKSDMDLEVSGYGVKEEMKDTESTMYLVRGGYGLSDGCEFHYLVGFSDISSEDFNGDEQFAWGFGTKFTVAEKDQITWGGLFQMCSIKSDGKVYVDFPEGGGLDVDIEAQVFDIQIAFGPTYTQEGFSIYGGPFLHFVDGDLDMSVLGESRSMDIEQKSEFGGYVGVQFELAQTSDLFIEYQKTGDASAFAGGIVWRF